MCAGAPRPRTEISFWPRYLPPNGGACCHMASLSRLRSEIDYKIGIDLDIWKGCIHRSQRHLRQEEQPSSFRG